MPQGIDLSKGVEIKKPDKEASVIPEAGGKFWNSQTYFIGAMMGNISSILFSVFGLAEELAEHDHEIKIQFIFDNKQLHGVLDHRTPKGARNRYGFQDIEELMKLIKLFADEYLHNPDLANAQL